MAVNGSRNRSIYSAAIGLAVGVLLTGLLIPFIHGERTDLSTVAGDGLPAPAELATGPSGEPIIKSGDPDATSPTGGSPGTASSGPSSAGSTGSGGGTEAPAATPGGAAALTASDRGVFPDRIKVGFLVLDIATVGRLGVSVAIDPEQQRVAIQAYVDDLNARGGIHGRKIEPYTRTFDVVNEDDQRAACLDMADQKVFAVVIGFNLPNPILCLVEQYQIPLFNNVSNAPDWLFTRSKGLLFGAFAKSSRMMAVWAAELERMGLLAGQDVGILSDDGGDPGGDVGKQLEAAINRMGGRVVRRAQLNADLQTSASQVPVEVSQFQTAGVDLVLMVTGNTVRGTQFVQAADAQNYRPKYSVSDYSSNFTDSGSDKMPRAFAGSTNITATRNSEFRDPKRLETAAQAACKKTYQDRSGRTLAARGLNEYGLTMNICDMTKFFERSALAAGPNLTRSRLSAGVQSLGPVSTASWGDGSFAPGKVDMNDFVRINVWEFECKCWKPSDQFHRGRF